MKFLRNNCILQKRTFVGLTTEEVHTMGVDCTGSPVTNECCRWLARCKYKTKLIGFKADLYKKQKYFLINFTITCSNSLAVGLNSGSLHVRTTVNIIQKQKTKATLIWIWAHFTPAMNPRRPPFYTRYNETYKNHQNITCRWPKNCSTVEYTFTYIKKNSLKGRKTTDERLLNRGSYVCTFASIEAGSLLLQQRDAQG